MKHIVILIGCVFLVTGLFAQSNSSDCSIYYKGYFSYTDSAGNIVLVDRLKKYQYERNTATKVKTQFRLKWITPCTYQITQAITNSKAARKYRNQLTEIKIVKTDGSNGYSYACNCPASDIVILKGDMKKLTKQEYQRLYTQLW